MLAIRFWHFAGRCRGTLASLARLRIVNGLSNSDVFEDMERQDRTHANMEATDSVDTKQFSLGRVHVALVLTL
ncbi:hypothetical protein MSG28_002505 [Choristoneura fumiferana]|uniref:Uncharacterized protein n=1 Tax=Choristoneura fumiferana TaxID=7141 RepID=A0ACC0JVZ1_CHOFU|nr:hypothetical protein MSG28_002505 [Choristoneura fumiferana]